METFSQNLEAVHWFRVVHGKTIWPQLVQCMERNKREKIKIKQNILNIKSTTEKCILHKLKIIPMFFYVNKYKQQQREA